MTAYHSWLMGTIGSFIDPSWFSLYSSRGLEQQLLKVYMRATVVISEYFTYIPAAVILIRRFSSIRGVNKWESSIALIAILMQPATILIDHGHFQYNTVMLGFVLASMGCLFSDHHIYACVFFVSGLCYKQMALYYAPAIFAYLLGACLLPNLHVGRILGIATVTLLSFALIFAPILLGALYDTHRGISAPLPTNERTVNFLFSQIIPYIDPKSIVYPLALQLTQAIHRIFPFARGLFEDKVANIWCAIHTLHKLHTYPIPLLQRVSLSATLIAILPACMSISLFPRKELLPWAMASCAWGFFLFSFQVHEKSVLLPLLPMTILLSGESGLGIEMRAWIGWANMLGVWTIFPLLKRDELRVPYYVLSLLWAYLMGLPPTRVDLYFGTQSDKGGMRLSTKALHLAFYAAMVAWHLVEAFVETPEGKPDLWVVANVFVGVAGFGVCYLWCTWQLILKTEILDEWFGFRAHMQEKTEKARENAEKVKEKAKEKLALPSTTSRGTRATPPREAKSARGQKKL